MEYRETMKALMACITLLALLTAGCTSQQQNRQCGIENCHGLNVQCGSNAPQACTADYRLGDFCRQYAECSVVQGACTLLVNEKFTTCKACVEECERVQEPTKAFECEQVCRTQLSSE